MTKCGNYRDPDYRKKWYERNREKILQKKNEHYKNNKERYKLYNKIHYIKKNPDSLMASYAQDYMKEYYQKKKKLKNISEPLKFSCEKKNIIISFEV
jgi:hypothetical protein